MQQKKQNSFEYVRGLFPHTRNVTYFNSASYGPFSEPVRESILENLDLRVAAARDDSHSAFSIADELRTELAGLIGARKREVGIGLNTTFGLNIAAFGLPFRRGDEILLSDVEFPAAVYTFKGAAVARGLRVRLVKSRDRCFDIDEFVRAIKPRTRALVISFVQFFNGYKNDLAAIGEICRKHGMYLIVDGIQGMGAEAINVRTLGIDVFSSGCQKWMLCPQGCGFFYLSDAVRDTITPPFMSWVSAEWKMQYHDLFYYDKPYFDSARRFEMGYYVTLNYMGMKASVDVFRQLGIRNIQKHNHLLIDRLAAYLRTNPYYRITSALASKHRSSIFTFSCNHVVELHRELLKHKIILVHREGSIRVSVHLFNNEADIDRLIAVLDQFSRVHAPGAVRT